MDSPTVPNQSASKRIGLLFGGASGFQIVINTFSAAIYLKCTNFLDSRWRIQHFR